MLWLQITLSQINELTHSNIQAIKQSFYVYFINHQPCGLAGTYMPGRESLLAVDAETDKADFVGLGRVEEPTARGKETAHGDSATVFLGVGNGMHGTEWRPRGIIASVA